MKEVEYIAELAGRTIESVKVDEHGKVILIFTDGSCMTGRIEKKFDWNEKFIKIIIAAGIGGLALVGLVTVVIITTTLLGL